MIEYTTQLTPPEIRARLDKYLPVPWAITARKPWIEALGALLRPTAAHDFCGKVGPGWFQLTYRPRGRKFVPTILGTFEKDGDHTRVFVQVSRMGTRIGGDLMPLLFLVVATHSIAVRMDVGRGITTVLLGAILFALCRLQVKHYATVSLKKLKENLRLIETTQKGAPNQ